MSDDFFGDLGKSISRATQRAVDQTSNFFESTKITTQITSEKREIEKLYGKIGERIVRKVEKKETNYVGEEELAIVDEIRTRRENIRELRQSLADVKNMRICPNCEELIEKTAAFCPKCGAAVPVDDVEEETESPEQAGMDSSKEGQEKKQQEGEILDAAFDTVEDLSSVVDDVMDAGFTTIDDAAGAASVTEETDAEFVILEEKSEENLKAETPEDQKVEDLKGQNA